MRFRYPTLLAVLIVTLPPVAAQPAHTTTPALRDGLVERQARPGTAGSRRVEGPLTPAEVEARLGAPLGGGRFGGVLIASLDVPDEVDNVAAVVVSDDGERATAVGFYSDAITALSPSGETLWTTYDAGCGPYDVDDRGGTVVVACVRGRRVLVLDAATGAVRHRVSTAHGIGSVHLAQDGRRAVAGMRASEPTLDASRLLVLDTDSGTVSTSISAPFQGSGFTFSFFTNRERVFFTPIAIAPDGAHVAIGGFDGVQVFDAATGVVVDGRPDAWRPDALEFSGDGSALLATYTVEGPLRAVFFDLTSATHELALIPGDAFDLSAAIAPDGASALVALDQAAVRIAPGAEPVPVVASTFGRVAPLGAGQAAVVSVYGIASRVDLATYTASTALGTFEVAAPGRSRDGRSTVGTQDFEDIRLHDLAGAEGPVRLRPGAAPEPDGALFLALSEDGALAAVTHPLSGHVGLYDAATLETVALYETGIRAAGVAFLPGGELAVAGDDQLLRLDATTGEVLQAETLPGLDARHVFVAGGRVFVHVREARSVEAYDVGPDGLRYKASAPVRSILSTNLGAGTTASVAVTPDGGRVLGFDIPAGSIAVTDIESGTTTDLGIGTVGSTIAVSDDSRAAVATGADDRVHLVRLDGSPHLVTSVSLPGLASTAAAYDARLKCFWVAQSVDPVRASCLDEETASVVETRTLGPFALLHQLIWTPETGLVAAVTGSFQYYTGAPNSLATLGRLVTEAGAFALPTAPGMIAGPTAGGNVLATLPGPDGLAQVAGVPVAAEAPPAPELALRTLGSPGAQVRIDLRGAARPSLRIEAVDVLGRVVAVLHDGPFGGTPRTLSWADAPAGTYVVRAVGAPASVRATVVR